MSAVAARPSRADRARPVPVPRRHALAPLREARRAPRRKARPQFAVWAPNAAVGLGGRRLQRLGPARASDAPASDVRASGTARVPEARQGSVYKYHIVSRNARLPGRQGRPVRVSLPRTPPRTGSMVWDLDYEWHDADGCASARPRNALDAPMSVYEVHLGSWRRVARRRRTGCSATASSRRSSPTTRSAWASRTSS